MPTISTPDLPVTLLVPGFPYSVILALPAQYGEQRDYETVRCPSVRLSVPAWATAARFAAVARSAVDIVRLLHG